MLDVTQDIIFAFNFMVGPNKDRAYNLRVTAKTVDEAKQILMSELGEIILQIHDSVKEDLAKEKKDDTSNVD